MFSVATCWYWNKERGGGGAQNVWPKHPSLNILFSDEEEISAPPPPPTPLEAAAVWAVVGCHVVGAEASNFFSFFLFSEFQAFY